MFAVANIVHTSISKNVYILLFCFALFFRRKQELWSTQKHLFLNLWIFHGLIPIFEAENINSSTHWEKSYFIQTRWFFLNRALNALNCMHYSELKFEQKVQFREVVALFVLKVKINVYEKKQFEQSCPAEGGASRLKKISSKNCWF